MKIVRVLASILLLGPLVSLIAIGRATSGGPVMGAASPFTSKTFLPAAAVGAIAYGAGMFLHWLAARLTGTHRRPVWALLFIMSGVCYFSNAFLAPVAAVAIVLLFTVPTFTKMKVAAEGEDLEPGSCSGMRAAVFFAVLTVGGALVAAGMGAAFAVAGWRAMACCSPLGALLILMGCMLLFAGVDGAFSHVEIETGNVPLSLLAAFVVLAACVGWTVLQLALLPLWLTAVVFVATPLLLGALNWCAHVYLRDRPTQRATERA